MSNVMIKSKPYWFLIIRANNSSNTGRTNIIAYVEIENQIQHLRHRNGSRISLDRYTLYSAATRKLVLERTVYPRTNQWLFFHRKVRKVRKRLWRMLGTVKLSITYLIHKYCDIRRLGQVSHNLDGSQTRIPTSLFSLMILLAKCEINLVGYLW